MTQPAVVFDLDGTLIESAPALHAAANRMLAAEGRPPLSLALIRSFIGNGAPTLVSRTMAVSGMPSDPALHARLVASFGADYDADPLALTEPMPGAVEAVLALRAAGCRLGLCTNKSEAPSRAILAALGLAEAIEAVVGGDTLPVRKPDPAPLLLARDRLGGGPCLFVGDSEVDAGTAQAARVPLLLFTGGYRRTEVEAIPHHAAFDRFQDVSTLVSACAPGSC